MDERRPTHRHPCHHQPMLADWTDLDLAYLLLFGGHPDLTMAGDSIDE